MALDKLVDSSQLDADLTSVANAIRSKGGTSGQLAFPAGFVSAVGAIPTGGGASGETVIASGTFAGNNNYYITVPVGTKMPQTDFIFQFWADGEEDFPYDTNHKFAAGALLALKNFVIYDLSSTGSKSADGQISVNVDNSGTVTTVAMRPIFFTYQTVRNAAIGTTAAGTQITNLKDVRNADSFSVSLNVGNSVYRFPPNITYNWRILYFGSDPQNDIVEVA